MFKPLRMSDTAVVCSLDDSAIDWPRVAKDGESIEDAQKRVGDAARKNPAGMMPLVVAKEGEQITRFTIGVIPSDEIGRIQDECARDGKFAQLGWRSFLAGLRTVDPWPEKIETVRVGDVEYVAPAWIKRTFIRGLRDIGTEIGFYCWAFNRLTEDEIRL